jgi:cathepsin C
MTQVAEARMKVKYGAEPPQLSPQHLLTCNYMNEGCEGGWPLFNGYLAENGYLISEQCAPYLHKTKGTSCSAYEQCEPVAKLQSSYFLGGGFG